MITNVLPPFYGSQCSYCHNITARLSQSHQDASLQAPLFVTAFLSCCAWKVTPSLSNTLIVLMVTVTLNVGRLAAVEVRRNEASITEKLRNHRWNGYLKKFRSDLNFYLQFAVLVTLDPKYQNESTCSNDSSLSIKLLVWIGVCLIRPQNDL